MRIFILFIGLSVLSSCSDNRWDVEISETPEQVTISNYAEALYTSSEENFYAELPRLREEFPFFYSVGDSATWLGYRKDSELKALYQDSKVAFTQEVYQDITDKLRDGFKRFAYHFPDEEPVTLFFYLDIPTQFSLLDDGVEYLDTIHSVFVRLDNYLGLQHPMYRQAMLPQYVTRRFTPEHIPGDVFEEIAYDILPSESEAPALIDDMVRAGIARYFEMAMLPKIPDSLLFEFTQDEIEFCQQNEVNIWTYFVQQQLLFDTRLDTKQRFVMEAPFSKFGTDFDQQSPGRIAEWIGYQIVSSYMDEHPDLSLSQLVQTIDYQKLFRESKYKP